MTLVSDSKKKQIEKHIGLGQSLEDFLRHYYVEKQLPMIKVADLASTSVPTITKLLDEYGITKRKPGWMPTEKRRKVNKQIALNRWNSKRSGSDSDTDINNNNSSGDDLSCSHEPQVSLYVTRKIEDRANCDYKTAVFSLICQGESILAIAHRFDVSWGTIKKITEDLGISSKQSKKLSSSRQRFILEQKLGVDLGKVLRHLYVIQELSMEAIAQELGISTSSVFKWIQTFGIPSRGRGRKK